MNYSDWLSAKDAAILVRQTATATAKQLGHQLDEWSRGTDEDGEFYIAPCLRCSARALFRPRSFRAAGQAGSALTLRCEPHAKDRLAAARADAGLPPAGPPPATTSPWPAHAWGPLGPHAPPPRKP